MKEEFEDISALDLEIRILEEGAIDEKCRACTRLLDVKYNLLETWELSERFIRFSATQLDPDDLLPKSICSQCFQRLQDADNFQKICIESYALLLEHTANNLKQDASDSDCLLMDPIEDSASNRSKLLEFEEVVVSGIKDDCIKSEYQLHIDSEGATEKVIANQKINLFDEIDMSPKKMKMRRQPSRKRQTKTKKGSCEDEDESTLYTCEKCESTFDSEIHYKAHLRKHEGKKPYPCLQCTREYVSISLLEKHIHIEHSGHQPPKYECTVEGCDKKYRSQNALTYHHYKSHSNHQQPRERKKLMCETCGKYFSEGSIREHEMMHKGLAPYSCDQCEKKFLSSIRLERHKLIHLNIKQHSCPLCGIRMRSKKDIDWHMTVHTRERKFPCAHCELSFFTKAHILRHIRTVHYRIKAYVCTYCDESFGQSSTLQRHIMLHTGEKPHKCPYCEKRFVQKSKMKDHARLHEAKGDHPVENISSVGENTSTEVEEGFRNFECTICGLKTTYKELKSHMSVHKREQKHPCEICNEKFSTKGILVNHVRTVHDGIKLFQCQYCDKTFGKATTLRNHTMTHTGERPFQCPHCEKQFITRFALQYHEKKREKDIAKGKIPCSTEIATEYKAKEQRKMKSSSKIKILTTITSQADMSQTARQQTTSYTQDEMLV